VSTGADLDAFDAAPHTRGRGFAGEEAAIPFLEGEGYRIEARNVVTVAGEIDIVAWEGDVLCFVEVKARSTAEYGRAVEAVDRRKQRRLFRAASVYLLRLTEEPVCRFDVLGLDHGPDGWEITLLRDAFEG